jgi:hypothetical protein
MLELDSDRRSFDCVWQFYKMVDHVASLMRRYRACAQRSLVSRFIFKSSQLHQESRSVSHHGRHATSHLSKGRLQGSGCKPDGGAGPLKRPDANEILIKVEACGVCHSDVFAQENTFGGGFLRYRATKLLAKSWLSVTKWQTGIGRPPWFRLSRRKRRLLRSVQEWLDPDV